MNRERIIFDLDDVIVRPNILKIANEITGENKSVEELRHYYVEEEFSFTEEQYDFFYDQLVTRNLYENTNLVEGAYEILKKLSEDYEIFIASDSVIYKRERLSSKVFADKFDFIVSQLPFINPRNIILSGNKSVIVGSYMVDDKFDNLLDNKNVKIKVLFTAYHNKNITTNELIENDVIRVNTWNQLYKYITGTFAKKEIVSFLDMIFKYYFKREIFYDFDMTKNGIHIIFDRNNVSKENHTFKSSGIEVKQRVLTNKVKKILNIDATFEVVLFK